MLLTVDGRFQAAGDVDSQELTDVQCALLGLSPWTRPGVTQELNRVLAEMRIAAPESTADKGSFRLFPRGVLVHTLLRQWLEEYLHTATQGVEVQTPTLFTWGGPGEPLYELTESFGEHMYHVAGEMNGRTDLIMRYGGDPGWFALMKDVVLTDRSLPFHSYEYCRSFRRHRTGEVAGILRAREFTFYDHHAVCRDRDQAHEETVRMLVAQQRLLRVDGRRFELQFVVVDAALAELAAVMRRAVRTLDVPACVTVLSAPKHYYSLVSNFCDPHGLRTLQIQLDHENARRFGFAAAARWPDLSILHMSAGALERWLVSHLLDGLDQPRTATLPLWLAPVQVRVLPHTDAETRDAARLREALDGAGIRADIDDRSRSLGRRMAAAQREWVPLIAVIGRAEVADGTIDVLDRATGLRRSMTLNALVTEVAGLTAGFPSAPTVEPSVAGRPAYA